MLAQLQRASQKRQRNSIGFTIVELLIVVVIIGILAAIVIVAYNGITTQAENNRTIQAVAQYAKGLQMYATQNGHYPIVADGVYPCLGPHPGTSCGKRDSGTNCLGSGSTSSNATFDADMKTVLGSNLPKLSDQRMICGGLNYSGGYVVPNAPSGNTLSFYYFIKGDVSCDNIGGAQSVSKSQQDDTTRCRVNMPTL